MITQERLKEILDYCPETGVFSWKVKSGRRLPGDVAGYVSKIGYCSIKVDGRSYQAHRLAFLWMTGVFPIEIDHKDHNRSNNKWGNLRAVSHKENQRNQSLSAANTSGVPGVCWHKYFGKWHSKIMVDGRQKHLGYFVAFEDAVAARMSAEARYGFHGNHGKECRSHG